MPEGATEAERSVAVTDGAARRIAQLAAAEGKPGVMLRVTVSGGGCSGFKYGFDLDDKTNDDDRLFRNGDATVVVDEVSLDLLKNAHIDYVEDLVGSYFAIKNPNASSTCGCGSSFSV